MTRLRDKRIALRASVAEFDIIKWAADARGLSVSEYVRSCALEKAGQAVITMYPQAYIPQPRSMDASVDSQPYA